MEVGHTAAYLLNRRPTRGKGASPFELRYGTPPDTRLQLPIGSYVIVKCPERHGTLGNDGRLGKLIGYSSKCKHSLRVLAFDSQRILEPSRGEVRLLWNYKGIPPQLDIDSGSVADTFTVSDVVPNADERPNVSDFEGTHEIDEVTASQAISRQNWTKDDHERGYLLQTPETDISSLKRTLPILPAEPSSFHAKRILCTSSNQNDHRPLRRQVHRYTRPLRWRM